MTKHRLTILGCGPSGGVPRIGTMWGSCDPQNSKNRRRRCSVMFEQLDNNKVTRVLVDTPPDLREQLIDVRVDHLDAVIFTHDHADHTHGIDDLRPVCYAMKSRINTYFDAPTGDSLETRFSYCFAEQPGTGYAPILRANRIVAGDEVRVEGAGGVMVIKTVPQHHGNIETLGLRVGNIGYSPDISDFPPGSAEIMEGLDLWVVDALRHTPHPSHFHLKRALQWIERLQPKQALLTHMMSDLDYDTLCRDLPPNVRPAYDGLQVTF
ncbi:MAG: MBL fold metallo-hydrolase [Hyphomicrobiaceae bacterium]